VSEKKRKKTRELPDRQSYLNHRAHAEAVHDVDGVTMRRLMVPEQHAVVNFSLTELEIAAGQMVDWPPSPRGEKVWHILNGAGLMILGNDQFALVPGDVIHIAPGLAHQVHSRGQHPLQLLCITCPPHPGKHDVPEAATP